MVYITKEKNLVELTEAEFIKNIFYVIEQYDDQLEEIIKDQKQFYKLYNNYLVDKSNAKVELKFYLKDNTRLFYEIKNKRQIGYRRGSKE